VSFSLLTTAGLVVLCGALLLGAKLRRGLRERTARRWDLVLTVAAATHATSEPLQRLLEELAGGRDLRLDLLRLWKHHVAAMERPERIRLRARLLESGAYRRLLADLSSPVAIRRGCAAVLVGELRLPGVADALERLLADREPDVCNAALKALSLVADESAAWALLRALRDGLVKPDRIVERLAAPWAGSSIREAWEQPEFRGQRGSLITALSLAADPATEQLAVELLEDSDLEARLRACRALGGVRKSGSTVECLVEALNDESASVRAQAAKALHGVQDEQVIARLAAALSDRAWWVRANAGSALRESSAGLKALRLAVLSSDPFARDRAREELSLQQAGVRVLARRAAA